MALSAAALVLAGCAKDFDPGKNDRDGELMECILQAEVVGAGAGLNIDTKVALNADGVTPNWETGDEILVLGADYKPVGKDGGIFTLSTGAGSASGKFTGTAYVGQKPTYAIYPASAATTNDEDPVTGGSLLYTAGDKAGTFKAAVMLGTSSDGMKMDFSNACAVLTFNTGDYGKTDGDLAIKSVKVSASYSTTATPIAGAFNINWSATPPTITAASSGTVSELTIELPAALQANDKNVFIPIFPLAMQSSTAPSMTFEFTNTDDIPAEVSYDFSAAIAANTMKNLGVASGMEFKEPELPDWMTGVFSISSTKKVVFSKGFLYYDGAEFKFENCQSNQRKRPGDDAIISHKKTKTPTGNYGSFYWHRSPEGAMADSYPMRHVDYPEFDYQFYDIYKDDVLFASNLSIGGNQCYILSKDDWCYLAGSTRMVNIGMNPYLYIQIYEDIMIEGVAVQGEFFFPDNYNGSQEIGSESLNTWKEIFDAGILYLAGNSDISSGYIWTGKVKEIYEGMMEAWIYAIEPYDNASCYGMPGGAAVDITDSPDMWSGFRIRPAALIN